MGSLKYINDHAKEISGICKTCANNNKFPQCWTEDKCINERVIEIKQEFINLQGKYLKG